MKTSQKQQKASQNQTLLDEYMSLKPNRAVQRLLQQNDLGYCIELYNLLQQNVKSNTNQLRSVLYSKHQNLHQCSQMIEKIQQFAYKVKNIQQEIDSCLNAPIVSDDWKLDSQHYASPVQKIEQLMNDKKFSGALRECRLALNEYEQNKSYQSDQNEYYIKFLKVEIIQKLQQYLQETPLSSEIITEAIQALKQFMSISSIEQVCECIQQSITPASQAIINPLNNQGQAVSILKLLNESFSQTALVQKSYPLSEDQLVEVIFKFKLLSIKQSSSLISYENPQQKIQQLYNKIFNYFSDLLSILDQVQKKYSKEKSQAKHTTEVHDKRNKLYQIFNLNIQKAVAHISELFITRQTPQSASSGNYPATTQSRQGCSSALSFQMQHFDKFSELYEKLLSSKEFISTLDSLSDHFKHASKESQVQQMELLSIIKNLWKDFYHQMLDIITQKIDPILWFKIPQSNQLPEQLDIFQVTQFSKLTKDRLDQYQKQISMFFTNFTELLNKSRSVEEKESIVGYFLELKAKIYLSCERQVGEKRKFIDCCGQRKDHFNNKKKAQHQIRELILMFLLIKSYNLSWSSQLQNESPLHQVLPQINKPNVESSKFKISLFEPKPQVKQQQQLLYQTINNYLDLKIQVYRLSETQYIQRWQQQLDYLFGSYSSLVRINPSLKEQLKHLILTLIKTKLHSLQAQ